MGTNEEFLRPRIRVVLSSVGFCERYQAFDYLVETVCEMCQNKDETFKDYLQMVDRLSKYYNIAPISITGQIGVLIMGNKDFCNRLDLTNKRNFQRLKTIANFVQEEMNKRFVN